MLGTSTGLQRLLRVFAASMLTTLAVACGGGDSAEKLIASAKDFLGKGDSRSASIQLKNALQAAPDNGEARLLLGKASLEMRDFLAADKELRRALELNQPTDEVLPLLARAMTELGQQDVLIKDFGERRLGDAQAQATFQTLLGDAYLQRNDRAAAAKAYSAAIEAKADYAPAQLGRVSLLAIDGRMDEALVAVDAILATSPKFARAHAVRGELLLARNDSSGARKALEAAIDADPISLEARLALINLLLDDRDFDAADRLIENTRRVAPRDPRVSYFDAVLTFGKGELDKARERVQQVLKQMPDHVPSLVLAGALDYRERRLDAAEANLRKAVARAPRYAGARQLLVLTYLRMGQPAKAKETLQPLLETGVPQSPTLLMLAGETFLANGDPKTASAFYQAVSKAGQGKAAAAKTRLGQIALAGGRAEEGIRELEAASELDAKQFQADLAIIAAHLSRQEFDKALKATKALEKKQPNNPLTYQVVGEIQLAKRDSTAAQRSFEKALSLQPGYLPAARRLAQMDLAAKRPEDARKRYEAMIGNDSKNDQLYLAFAEFESKAGADAKTVAAILQRAVEANPQSAPARSALIILNVRNKDLKLALAQTQSALAAMPADPLILEAAGTAQQLAGEVNQAIETNNKWAALQPDSAKPLMRLADLYLGQKNYDRAIDELRRARKVAPNAPEVATLLVQAYTAANRSDDALNEARDLQKKEPRSAIGYELEGDIYARQKKFAQAEKAYRDALRITPGTVGVAINFHRVLVSSGKAAEAETFVNKWTADNPKNLAIRLYLAERETSAGNLKAAAAHYRAVIEREPNSALALNNLAWIGSEIGDPKALSYAERAAELAPDHASVLDTYGTLLIKQGQAAKGLDYLARASTLDSGKYGVRRLKYARALAQAGQKDLARKELEGLQAVPEDFPGKSDIPALLKAL